MQAWKPTREIGTHRLAGKAHMWEPPDTHVARAPFRHTIEQRPSPIAGFSRCVACCVLRNPCQHYVRARLSLRGQDIREFLFVFDPQRHCERNKAWRPSRARHGRHHRKGCRFIRCDVAKYGTSLPTFRTNILSTRRTASSGMLRPVALVRTDVSEELRASFIRVTRFGELGTTLAVTSNRRTLRSGAKFLRNVGSYKSLTA
jgi:hypothetical protein